MKRKPLLFLDVDGVLNVPMKYDHKPIYPGTLPFFPTPVAKDFLRLAWKRFHVVWLTCWFEHANALAHWAGLKSVKVLDGRRSDADDWKAGAVEAYLKQSPREEGCVFWVEDGFSPEAELLIDKYKIRAFRTDTYTGITLEWLVDNNLFNGSR